MGHLLTSSLGLIQNFAMDSSSWPHFKLTRFVDILKIHTKTSEEGIRFMSLYTLLLLVEIIPAEKQDILFFEKKVIREYIDILDMAVSSPKLEATKVYGSYVIPADDILRLLKQLWYMESNRSNIASFFSSLLSPIEVCVQMGNEMQKEAALDLLWSLISDPSILLEIKNGHIRIDLKLMNQLVNSSPDVSSRVRLMASCVLHSIDPEVIESGT